MFAPVFAHLARAIEACYFVQQCHLPINGAPGGSPCTHLTRAHMLHGAAFTPEWGVFQRSRDLVLRLATLPPANGLVSSSPHCRSAASDYSRGFQLEYSRPRLIRTDGRRSACNNELLEGKTSAVTEGVPPRRDLCLGGPFQSSTMTIRHGRFGRPILTRIKTNV